MNIPLWFLDLCLFFSEVFLYHKKLYKHKKRQRHAFMHISFFPNIFSKLMLQKKKAI